MNVSSTSFLRFTGLASGIDTESIIEKMMMARKIPVDRLSQKKNLMEWKRDMLRDINTSMTALKSMAFDMKLSSSYSKFNITPSDTSLVTATWADGVTEGSSSIVVKQLATAAYRQSTAGVSMPLEGTAPVAAFDVAGKDFKVTFNGVSKTISWGAAEGAYANMAALVAGVQTKIDDAFGANQITVSDNGGKLNFASARSDYQQLIVVNNGTTNALTQFNISDGARSHLNLDTKLENIAVNVGGVATNLTFDGAGKLNFTINGSTFSLDKNDTFNDLISKVNADATANVTMKYDSLNDKFILTRKDSGAGKDVTISDGVGGNLTAVLQVGAQVNGSNSIIDYTVNGVTTSDLEQSSNNFIINGLNVTLLKADAAETVTLTTTKDVQAIYDKIKAFVDEYNKVITTIGTKLSEKRDINYQPLTEAQKKEMKEDEVTLWEDKAKLGILNNESILQTIGTNIRRAAIDKVTGLSASYDELYDIGIAPSSIYTDNGKLYINENKLKAAITADLDSVIKIFNNSPDPLQGQALAPAVVDVDGKDFDLTVGSMKMKLTLAGSYDLATTDGKNNFVAEIQTKIDSSFGKGSVTVLLDSNMKLNFTPSNGVSLKVNTGTVDALAGLGFADGDAYDSTASGLANKLYNTVNNGISDIINKAGIITSRVDNSTIGKDIDSIQDRIDEMNIRLIKVENRYYQQFTALEKAINQMNTQSTWLSQQFGGNQG